MADSVEERIVKDVLATVQAVTVANGWDVTVRVVQRQQEDIDMLNKYPGVIVVHDGTDYDHGRPGLVIATLRLAVQYGLECAGDTWPNDLAQLRDNLIQALHADTTRGTSGGKANARRTEITGGFTGDATLNGTEVTRGELSLSVRFGFETSDLTIAF